MATYSLPAPPRRGVPLALTGFGAAALLGGLLAGSSYAIAGAAVFAITCILALRDTTTPIFTWPNACALLVGVVWLIPIKDYTLPVNLPFQLEVYRLLILVLVLALTVQLIVGTERIRAAGHGKPVALLVVAALASLVVNASALDTTALQQQAIKATSYWVSFLIVFLIVTTTVRTKEQIDKVLMVLVVGGALVGVACIYESRTHYNVFEHLHTIMPFLKQLHDKSEKLRHGRIRVRGSAQHPIACGVALGMMAPLAVYLARRAASRLTAVLWLLCAGIVIAGALATVSRTVFAMILMMFLVGLWLRFRELLRLWPVLLVLPFAVHVAAPGVISGISNALTPKQGLTNQLNVRSGASGSGRLSDISPGLHMWKHSPFVGLSVGTQLDFESANHDIVVREASITAHQQLVFDDQYMTTLVQLGIVGLIALLWFVWLAVWRMGSLARRLRNQNGDLLAACAVACAGFGTSLATFDAFAFVQCSMLFFAIAGLGLSAHRLLTSDPSVIAPVRPRIAPRPAAALAGATSAAAGPAAPARSQIDELISDDAIEEREIHTLDDPVSIVAPAPVRMRTDLSSGSRAMARGAAINLGGSFAAFFLAFLFRFVITHVVPVGEYGRLSLALTIVMFAQIPSILGLDTGVIRFVARAAAVGDERRARGAAQLAIGLSLIASIVVTGIVLWQTHGAVDVFAHKPGLSHARRVASRSELASMLQLVAIALPFLAVGRVALLAVQGFGVMGYAALMNSVRVVVNLAAALPLLAIGMGVNALAWAFVVTAIVTCIASFWCLHRVHPSVFRLVPDTWRPVSMLRFSLPQTFTALMFFAILWTDTLLLGASRSLAEVGVYTIVGSLLQPATLVATAIGQMFAPRIAAEDARGDRATLGVMLKRVTYWNTAVSIPLFAMLAVVPGALLALFGPRYVSGAYALVILSIGQLINTCAGPLGQLINMSGRPYITAVNNAFVALLNLGMCAVLIPKYGMTGAACSTATALTLANLIKLFQVRVIFRLSPFQSNTLRTLLAIAVAAAVALAMKMLPWPNALAEVTVISAVLALVYGAVMWRFGTSAEDRELLLGAWRRLRRRAVRGKIQPAEG